MITHTEYSHSSAGFTLSRLKNYLFGFACHPSNGALLQLPWTKLMEYASSLPTPQFHESTIMTEEN